MEFNVEKFRLSFGKNILKSLSPNKKKAKKYFYLIGIIVFIYIFIAGDYGLYRYIVKKREESRLKAEIVELEKEQDKLLKEKELVEKGDLKVIEKIAREKYGLAKKDEKIFHTITKEKK